MKALIAVCLLLSPAMAQNTAPVQMESQSPSLALSFSGQQGGFYKFKVTNQSSHAVTAFTLLAVPAGIQKEDGRYACAGACTHSVTLADHAHPAIKAGAAVERSFPVSSVNGGVVVAEAAIFDDDSYDGEERAAAFLLAEQIGRQAEYDRLIAPVNAIMVTAVDDARKTTQIRSKLGELPVNLDPVMVQTFKRWFPDLAGCVQPYGRFMKAAAIRERSFVAESMERFAHGTAPGKPSLAQWWETLQQQLAGFGCNGCAAEAMKPNISAAVRSAAQGCAVQSEPIILVASADDGSPEGDAAELSAEDMDLAADLAEDDEAALDAADTTPATRPSPGTRPASPATVANVPAKPVEPTPQPSAKIDLPPQPAKLAVMVPPGVSRCVVPGGKGEAMFCRMRFNRESRDDVVYRAVFRDIGTAGDLALQEVVRWDVNGQLVENYGPKAGGLSDVEIALLKQVATQCNGQLADLWAKIDAILRTSLVGYPHGWLLYAPPLPELEALKEQQIAALNRAVARLRVRLGANSFARWEGFVNKVYRTASWKTVPVKLPDDAVYGYFLRYFAELDQLAQDNPLAKEEASRRQEELSKAGLNESARALLLKVALDFEKQAPTALPTLGAIAPGAVAPGPMPMQPPGPMQPAAGGQTPGSLQQTGTAIGAVTPPGLSPGQPGLIRSTVPTAELERRRDEVQLNRLSHIAQLRAGMSPATFQKLDGYLRQLYKKADWHKMVMPVAEQATLEATGK
jgi:hypothetical protein